MKYLKPNNPILLWHNSWKISPLYKTTNAYDELMWALEIDFANKIDAYTTELLIKLKFENGSNVSTKVIPAIIDETGQYNTCFTDWLEGNSDVYIEWICPISYVAELMDPIKSSDES